MYSRRLFLGASAAAVGLSACGGGTKIAAGKIDEVGIQTYTLREIFEPEPVGTLKMIKDVGYDYVELNRRNQQHIFLMKWPCRPPWKPLKRVRFWGANMLLSHGSMRIAEGKMIGFATPKPLTKPDELWRIMGCG